MSHSLFFFNDTATTEIYTLSLHDALPIYKIAQEQQIETERHRVEVARLQTEQQRLLNQTLSPEALMKQWIEVLHDMKNSNNLIIFVPTEGGIPLLNVGELRKNLKP